MAFPPPRNSSSFAFRAPGLCSNTVSKILPVTSPDAIRSAAAPTTAGSELSTPGAGFLSPVSMTVTARHSVSIWEGEEVFSAIFILVKTYHRAQGRRGTQKNAIRSKNSAHDAIFQDRYDEGDQQAY